MIVGSESSEGSVPNANPDDGDLFVDYFVDGAIDEKRMKRKTVDEESKSDSSDDSDDAAPKKKRRKRVVRVDEEDEDDEDDEDEEKDNIEKRASVVDAVKIMADHMAVGLTIQSTLSKQTNDLTLGMEALKNALSKLNVHPQENDNAENDGHAAMLAAKKKELEKRELMIKEKEMKQTAIDDNLNRERKALDDEHAALRERESLLEQDVIEYESKMENNGNAHDAEKNDASDEISRLTKERDDLNARVKKMKLFMSIFKQNHVKEHTEVSKRFKIAWAQLKKDSAAS